MSLWESTRARSQAQSAPVTVAARDGKRGELVMITGEHTVETMGRALGVYNLATNRAACRAGHVCVRQYRAARAAESALVIETGAGVVYGPPAPGTKEAQRLQQAERRRVAEAAALARPPVAAVSALEAILAASAQGVQAHRAAKALRG